MIGDEISAIVTKAGEELRIRTGEGHPASLLCIAWNPCARTRVHAAAARFRALEYSRRLEYKENTIRNHLKRIGGFENPPMEPIIGMDQPFYYRNKAQFPVGKDRDGRIITGFYAGRTHRIIDNRRCYLGLPVNEDILNRVISYMEECSVEPYDEETGTGIVRHVLIRRIFSGKSWSAWWSIQNPTIG